jgi:hypothetical protein
MKRTADERTTKGSAIAVYAIVAGIVLLSYVLSIGPVMGLSMRGYIGPVTNPYVELFYAPLTYIWEHNQSAAQFFDWYVSIFKSEGFGPDGVPPAL